MAASPRNPYPVLTDAWKRFHGGAETARVAPATRLRKQDHPQWVEGFLAATPGAGQCVDCGELCELGLEDNRGRLRCEGCYDLFMDAAGF